MKKLELTESTVFPGKTHKHMIMEMCNKLIGTSLVISDVNFDKIRISGLGDVPWLEVCLVHLPKVMATPNNRAKDIAIDQSCHLHEFFHNPKHIVDYLYEEFQNNKIWIKNKKS